MIDRREGYGIFQVRFASSLEIPEEGSNMPANHSLPCTHPNPLVPDTSAFGTSGMNSPTPERPNAVASPNACGERFSVSDRRALAADRAMDSSPFAT